MAMSKQFVERVQSLAAKGAKLAEVLQDVGQYAVKAAYANADMEPANFVIKTIPQYMRSQTASWFRRAGLNVNKPETGQKEYTVTGVLDQKRQAKAFEFITSSPILALEATEKKEPKKRELKGTPQTRAVDHMARLVGRLQESDYETACIINEKWSTAHYSNCLFDKNGNKTELDSEELELVQGLLMRRRMEVKLAA